jgi:adenylate cyclase
VRAGVGIHRGEVFVGAVGDDARLEFTVVGDTVNVAARVQELTRTVGCDLIATDPVLEAAGRARHEFVRLEPMPVRGRAQPIALWAHTRRPGAAARTGDAAG